MTEVTIWANLSHAYKEGQPIDWAALETSGTCAMLTCHKGQDCCKVQGHLRTSGAKDTPLADIDGWVLSGPTEFGLSDLMHDGWDSNGWVLWVEGEIPLLPEPEPVTADTLPVGACFMDSDGIPGMVFEDRNSYLKVAFPHEGTIRPAGEIKVQQVFGVGTFKPDGEADV